MIFLIGFLISLNVAMGCRTPSMLSSRSTTSAEDAAGGGISQAPSLIAPSLEDLAPAPWPAVPPSRRPGIQPAFTLRSILGSEASEGLACFTAGTCAEIHAVDALSDEDLAKRGYGAPRIEELRRISRQINAGLKRAPQAGVPVYRVIKSVAPQVVSELLQRLHGRQSIGLGEGFRPALASASWDTSLLEKRLSQEPSSGFHLLYVITQHEGVAIETLSPYPGEREVVLPSRAVFAIEGIAPLAGKKKILRVDLRGVPGPCP